MGIYLDHINSTLIKLRETPIAVLSTDTSTTAYMAQEAVRRAVQRVWNLKDWNFKARRVPMTVGTLTATHSQSVSQQLTQVRGDMWSVPGFVGEIYKVVSSLAPYTLTPVSYSQFLDYIRLQEGSVSGNPSIYSLFEQSPIDTSFFVTPADITSYYKMKVQMGSNDLSIVATITGIKDDGVTPLVETITTATAQLTTNYFSRIDSISINSNPTSYVSVALYNATSVTSTILGYFYPNTGVKSLSTRVLRMFPRPSAQQNLTVYYFQSPPTLMLAGQDSQIPNRWDYVVDQFAFAFALQSKGQEQLPEFAKQMEIAMKFLEEDMASEEFISQDQLIYPNKWGQQGDTAWGSIALPSGYGYEA